MTDVLERAISRFRRSSQKNGTSPRRTSAASFRASVELRLSNLERDVGDVKGRISGLIFVVLGAVIAQVVLRVVRVISVPPSGDHASAIAHRGAETGDSLL